MLNRIASFCLVSGVALLTVACGSRDSGDTSTQKAYTNCKLAASSANVSIGGWPRNSNRIATTGTVNATVIMVDFPDAVATLTPAQAYAKISGSTATFTEQSYSQFTYTLNPQYTWYRMSQNSTAYPLTSNAGVLAYIQEAVTLADADVNFANTDVLIVLANPDASSFSSSGPSHPYAPGSGITADGNEMYNMITSGYDLSTWNSMWLTHETTHLMGLVDLYAYSYSSSITNDLIRYVGYFSYMGYNSFSSNSPGLTAWERYVLGWVSDSQVECANPLITGEINTLITPISSTGGKKAVIVPIGSTKVLVVESRRRSGIDANMVKEGALVYVVDSSLASGYGAIQVYPTDSKSNGYLQAPLAAGESVTVSGIKVEVLSASSSGDSVRISDTGNWIRFAY
jgi:M6 family metalloprotease-like protein